MLETRPEAGLPPPALTVERLGWVAGAAVVCVLLLVIDVGIRVGDQSPSIPPAVVPILVAGAVLAFGWAWSPRVHRAWRYELSAEWLRVEWGVITRHVSLVPRSRVQHVSTHHGPLQRRFGLTSITVHTAGARTPNVEIPNLLVEVAADLRHALIGSGGDART